MSAVFPSAAALPALAAGQTGGFNLIDLVTHSGPLVTGVLLILVGMSVACWGIIVYKYFYLRKAELHSIRFLELFWETRQLDRTYEESEKFATSPVAQVFRSGYAELYSITRRRAQADGGLAREGEGLVRAEPAGVESIERAMRRAATAQVTVLESLVGFLATTGSTAPFIGLFGTVWGIMKSFHEIGVAGNASLATVAPGISEALIATAAGLAAAIPAVVGYNYFVNRIKVHDSEMNTFASDFLGIVERHLMK